MSEHGRAGTRHIELLTKKRTRREFLVGIALAGGALVGGCAGPAATPTAAPTTPAAPKPTTAPQTPAPAVTKVATAAEAANVVAPKAARGELPECTLTVAILSGPEADAHKRLAPEWEKYSKGKCKVVVEDLGRGEAGTTKLLATMLAKSDAWDVVYTLSLGAVANISAGFFEPLGPLMAKPDLFNAKAYDLEDFPTSVRGLYTYNKELFLFSQQLSTMLTYYRKDLLDKYGLPHPKSVGWTWEELRDTCLKLKEKLAADGKADVFPLVFGVKKASHSALSCEMILWGNGVEWFDEAKQRPAFYQPGSLEAMTFVMDLMNKDKVVSQGCKDYEYAEVLTAQQQGKAVIALQWDAAAATLADKSKSPETAGKLGYACYPVFKKKDPSFTAGYFHGSGIGVSAFSKKKEAAFEYITWFTSKEIARNTVVKGGGSSGRTSVLTDPQIQKDSAGHLQAFSDMLKQGHKPYETPALQWIRDSGLGPIMHEAWTGMKSLEQALKDSDAEITNEYRNKGWLK